jgi:hypothetical protein
MDGRFDLDSCVATLGLAGSFQLPVDLGVVAVAYAFRKIIFEPIKARLPDD